MTAPQEPKSRSDFQRQPPALIRNDIDIARLIVALIEIDIVDKVKKVELSDFPRSRDRLIFKSIACVPSEGCAAFRAREGFRVCPFSPSDRDFGLFSAERDLQAKILD